MNSVARYLLGILLGFVLTVLLLTGVLVDDPVAWASTNLGHSTWLFLACLLAFLSVLSRLDQQVDAMADYERVAQLDQVSDVLIHVFVGIGVIWTAVGMRNALVTTLSVPDDLASDATHVLARLVDGGILLALTTTIVGAIGGYLMRLFKTVSTGARLTAYYQQRADEPMQTLLVRLGNIERLLEAGNARGAGS